MADAVDRRELTAETIAWIANDTYLNKKIVPRIKSLPRDVRLVLIDLLNKAALLSKEAEKSTSAMLADDARNIAREVSTYVCGWYKSFPSHWMDRAEVVLKEEEPEYLLYKELKKQFEG